MVINTAVGISSGSLLVNATKQPSGGGTILEEDVHDISRFAATYHPLPGKRARTVCRWPGLGMWPASHH